MFVEEEADVSGSESGSEVEELSSQELQKIKDFVVEDHESEPGSSSDEDSRKQHQKNSRRRLRRVVSSSSEEDDDAPKAPVPVDFGLDPSAGKFEPLFSLPEKKEPEALFAYRLLLAHHRPGLALTRQSDAKLLLMDAPLKSLEGSSLCCRGKVCVLTVTDDMGMTVVTECKFAEAVRATRHWRFQVWPEPLKFKAFVHSILFRPSKLATMKITKMQPKQGDLQRALQKRADGLVPKLQLFNNGSSLPVDIYFSLLEIFRLVS